MPLETKKTNLEMFLGQNQIQNLDSRYYFYGISVAFFIIFPMSMYRFYTNDFVIGMFDLAISLLLLSLSISIWRRKKVQYVNYVVFGISSIFMLIIVSVKGINSFMWIFAFVGIGYYTINKTVALASSILLSLASTLIVIDQITTEFLVSYYPALILLNILLYLGASKSENQQSLLFELATIDSLTRVKNRLAFNEKLDDLSASLSRSNQTVSIMILDIDHFKKINDTFGHAEGDEVLAVFAKLIKASIRSSDSVYRYGGEEFVVLAYNSNLDSAAKLAESIREKVAAFPSLAKYDLTVSIGVTEIPAKDENATSWLDRADEALYLSKKRGRNKVYLALHDETSHTDSYQEYAKYFNLESSLENKDEKIVSLNSYKA
ncbi:hypothetical protein GCM10009133_36010 [Cocleimonas flava]|uniref:diguanylate cyclase n=1 Tax=Cocleimonas flava TaxID=634765 RepID=A0A4R1F2Y3_9GAMM|nr:MULTISPECIES: GGDEF domain-containing protein [Cocleimonas]MEB8430861.1 GGDEF domain-containing protein [Cocleimonas sp. KMM 6892]MEC4714367.1 GGDEF domain-containing protein [Cocleimonas sp. KMM 6895]MEC4743698.1 GGDEF domain-containing protein [Cocleimonas sp. KMM 6896]TCJ88557.1 diguanylate cyclase (GGDEF)-like protein [Cocleimonas flava]